MENSVWIAFFSQTGSEIANLAKSLNRWPDRIITNDRPDHLRIIDPRIEEKGYFTLSNKPTLEEYNDLLLYFPEALITLHGWLRVVPPEICKSHSIYNGHPGLITDYPELKGKDPQMKAFKAKHDVMGCVLHKVTAGVDEGAIISKEFWNAWNITEEDMWNTFKGRQEYLWINFLKPLFYEAK
jgi:hypothetical protein